LFARSGTAEQVAEKLFRVLTSAAEAATENRPVIAALEALRHPKSGAASTFSAACEAVPSATRSNRSFSAAYGG